MKKLFALFLCLFCALPLPLYSQGDETREAFSKAHQLFSQGSLAEAEELFLKTLDRGFLLEDYSLYFLGAISFSRGNLEVSRAYFSRLKESFSQSVWSVHADLQLARISLAEKDYRRAAETLRPLRSGAARKEISNEALYLLAQTHQGQGELNRSHSLFQELRKLSPLSPWAAKARDEVRRLREEHPQLFGLRAEALSQEGELLLREREYQEAERAYRKLLELVPEGPLRPRFLMGLASVHLGSRKRQAAIPVLTEIIEKYGASADAPNALHRLAWIYWNRDENLTALDHFQQLKERYPQSAYVDYAHFASARIYESLGRAEEALEIYRDFPKKFPGSPLREEARWRLAWIHYLRGNHRRARAAFTALAQDKAGERYKAAALYWQARSAEKMGQAEEAKRIYLRILNGEDESYYTAPAARALEKMGHAVEQTKAENSKPLPEAAALLGPERSFHLSRAQELARISLSHLAVGELDEIKMPGSDDLPLRLMLIREYARNNAYSRSVALASQIPHPSDDLKRHRYPLAYWELIRKIAKERNLDPYLVVALIRQESLFDPKALSPASAFGLMQLLPSTAARAAAQLGLPRSRPEKLFEPDLNLALGTHYLKELLQRYSNDAVKAIAAYNAGENAVARWEKQLPAEDEEEFIERIPYGETRLYVKLVLRNHRIYQRLYPDAKKEPRQE
jgi:soluble lytic murein transglycosylase